MTCKSCGYTSEDGVHSCEGFKLQQGEAMPSGAVRDEIMLKQVGGNHYKKNKIQPWDIIDEYELDFYEGNALKYLLRDKSETDAGKRREDLEKALHYIEKKLTEWDEHPRQSHMSFPECNGLHGKSIKAEEIR